MPCPFYVSEPCVRAAPNRTALLHHALLKPPTRTARGRARKRLLAGTQAPRCAHVADTATTNALVHAAPTPHDNPIMPRRLAGRGQHRPFSLRIYARASACKSHAGETDRYKLLALIPSYITNS